MKKKALFIDRDGTIIIEPPITEQVNSLDEMQQKCEVKLPDLELDKNYKGSLSGFLEFKKDLVLNLLEEYLCAKN